MKIYKRKFYYSTWFFAFGENELEVFGVWISGDGLNRKSHYSAWFKRNMYDMFDEKCIFNVPKDVQKMVQEITSDPFFEIEFFKQYSHFGVILL